MNERKTSWEPLHAPVTSLKGVGPAIAKSLARKGIETVDDLLYLAPVRWLDRVSIMTIGELAAGEDANIVAFVDSYRSMFFRHARKKGFEVIVGDGTGFLSLKWFRWSKGYLQRICKKGNKLFLSGKVANFAGVLQMVHPEVVVIDGEEGPDGIHRIIPLYPQVDGIKQGSLRKIVIEAVKVLDNSCGGILPVEIEEKFAKVLFADAVRNIHTPEVGHFNESIGRCSIERLILEEYIHFQTTLLSKKKDMTGEPGVVFRTGGLLHSKFLKGLGFELTYAQSRVIREIEADMGREIPMNRLLQGDVGSGKTVCAVAAACIAIDNGYQVAFMAPTEILAEQHFLNVHRWFDKLGVTVSLLKGNMGARRNKVLEEIRNGKVSIVIGTHAIIQQDVDFAELGLVIIDEQHRFGVEQRKKLKDKTARPDVLSMTATPIPRTLSMVLYGDLDVSVIDEIPPGRQKIWTKVIANDEKGKAHEMIGKELKAGNGAFIVYPLVDKSEKEEIYDATGMASYLQGSVFPDHRVGLLHGRMKTPDKEDIMNRFRQGDIDVLVCTTVIEVGIDVPRATIMVIENAERFGLSQLHQLRGRVGRGAHPSKCILVASTKRTQLATKRLLIMEKTNDGFVIAEEDLRIRGVGDMLGVKQSGLPRFRIGDIVKDIDIMISARKISGELIDGLSESQIKGLLKRIGDRFDDRNGYADIA